eukprot:366112-Chlamydomonas_euryale.AAC.9
MPGVHRLNAGFEVATVSVLDTCTWSPLHQWALPAGALCALGFGPSGVQALMSPRQRSPAGSELEPVVQLTLHAASRSAVCSLLQVCGNPHQSISTEGVNPQPPSAAAPPQSCRQLLSVAHVQCLLYAPCVDVQLKTCAVQ